MKTDKMLARKEKHIGWLTFNNPARLNAVSLEMWEGLADIAQDFTADPSIRVVVVQGAGGKAFVSGKISAIHLMLRRVTTQFLQEACKL